jgi:hypothetical protein
MAFRKTADQAIESKEDDQYGKNDINGRYGLVLLISKGKKISLCNRWSL